MFAIGMYSLQKYGVLLVFVLISGIFFSCNRLKSHKNELADPVFRAILVDAFMSEAYISEEAVIKNFNAASLMNQKIYPQILKKHKVDSLQFVHTFDYYLHHPDEFKLVLGRVQDSLNLIAEKAPVSTVVPVQAPTVDAIQSDSALAEDAMSRFRLLDKRNQTKEKQGKKTN